MAGFAAIAATGKSIERYLSTCFEELQPVSGSQTRAVLTTTVDLDTENSDSPVTPPALSIFLYRVDFNKTMRAAWSGVGTFDGRGRLPLDLHYLLTAWADNAEHEQMILGRAMQCLESTPVLAGPLLYSAGGWAANENVQLALEDISTEALMRVFDSLPVKYRLSVPYVARVVRIDGVLARPETTVTEAITGLVPSLEP